jgi:hypothetical protein
MTDWSSEELVELFLTLPPDRRDAEFQLIKQVAFTLNKHCSTIRRWVEEGRILGVKVFGSTYVYLPSLKEALKRYQGG